MGDRPDFVRVDGRWVCVRCGRPARIIGADRSAWGSPGWPACPGCDLDDDTPTDGDAA